MSKQQYCVLIVEDDPLVRSQISAVLSQSDINSFEADSIAAIKDTHITRADAMVLDRNLPDGEGLHKLTDILQIRSLPTLILSALGETRHKVEGLEAGAEDYLVKPFAPDELLARVKVLLRRAQLQQRPRITQIGPMELDRSARVAHINQEYLKLNPKQFDLLLYFCDHYQQVLTRAMLLEHVWNLTFDPQTNVVDVSIKRLRAQLEKAANINPIINVRGKGFILNFDEGTSE